MGFLGLVGFLLVIFFSLTIPNNTIDYIFTMWDDLYMLSNDGVLYKLHERPINQQIELILQRSLFNIAYDLATQANLSNDMLLKIQVLHGDHLYDKSEFEESIDAYIKCLTHFCAFIYTGAIGCSALQDMQEL